MLDYYDEDTLKTVKRITLDVEELKKIVEHQKKELLKIVSENQIRSDIDKNFIQLEMDIIDLGNNTEAIDEDVKFVFPYVYNAPMEEIEALHEEAESGEESNFYMALMNYKLQEPQRKIIKKGGFVK